MVYTLSATFTAFLTHDIRLQLRTRHIAAIALPKTNSPDHVDYVVSRIQRLCDPDKQRGERAIRIIAMIESARALIRIKEIAQAGKGHLDALLVSIVPCSDPC